MKSFYLLTLAAAVALAACSNDDSTPDPNPSPADTGLVIEQTEYTLDALDNRSTTLTFSASADWTLTVTGEDADWLTVTPASGTAPSRPTMALSTSCTSICPACESMTGKARVNTRL